MSTQGEEWRGISVAAEHGGPDVAGWVSTDRMQLNNLFEKYCAIPYNSEVTGIAIALRVEGNVKSYGFTGIDNIHRLRKRKAIGADISIERKDWESDPTSFRIFLWGSVQEAIWACVEQLKQDNLAVDETRLRGDLARVGREFFGEPVSPTATSRRRQPKAAHANGGQLKATRQFETSGIVGVPRRIKIRREESHHTHYIGRYQDGTQFMGFLVSVPAGKSRGPRRWYSVAHHFDSKGKHLNTDAVFLCAGAVLTNLEKAQAKLKSMIDTLGSITYEDVEVCLFSVAIDGHVFGLIDVSEPEEQYYKVELVPNGLTFFPPWDGTYQT